MSSRYWFTYTLSLQRLLVASENSVDEPIPSCACTKIA